LAWLGPFGFLHYVPSQLPIISFNKTSCAWVGERRATKEPAPTSTPWRMNGKWSGSSFLLGSSSLANQPWWLASIGIKQIPRLEVIIPDSYQFYTRHFVYTCHIPIQNQYWA
jgi:hypothetical protein